MDKTVLKIPDNPNIEVKESAASIYWFDEDGIFCSITKKLPTPIPFEEGKALMEDFFKMANGRKFCMLGDVTYSRPSDRQSRDYAKEEFPKVVKAMAMVSASVLGRTLGKLFLAIVPTPYPAKMFNTVEDAKAWLKQYLN